MLQYQHFLETKMLHALCLQGGLCEKIQISNYWTVYFIPIFCEQGGGKFHILLWDMIPSEINSCVACFQNCGTVRLEQTVNPFTLTGFTPGKFSLVLLILMFFLPMYFFVALMLNCRLHCSRMCHKTYDIVRLRNGSQKLVLISRMDTRICVSISDWLVSYAPCDWSYSCKIYHAVLKINMVASIL